MTRWENNLNSKTKLGRDCWGSIKDRRRFFREKIYNRDRLLEAMFLFKSRNHSASSPFFRLLFGISKTKLTFYFDQFQQKCSGFSPSDWFMNIKICEAIFFYFCALDTGPNFIGKNLTFFGNSNANKSAISLNFPRFSRLLTVQNLPKQLTGGYKQEHKIML